MTTEATAARPRYCCCRQHFSHGGGGDVGDGGRDSCFERRRVRSFHAAWRCRCCRCFPQSWDYRHQRHQQQMSLSGTEGMRQQKILAAGAAGRRHLRSLQNWEAALAIQTKNTASRTRNCDSFQSFAWKRWTDCEKKASNGAEAQTKLVK